MEHEKILILDFGGQYTQLIAKRVRECNVFSEIKSTDCKMDEIREQVDSGVLKGIILSGGPDSVYEKDAPAINKSIFNLGIPVLGICYGMQLMNYILGGGILHGNIVKEYGETNVNLTPHPLFTDISNQITAWMSHGDSVDGSNLANGFQVIARTDNHVAAIANNQKNLYAVQFHPEVTHTQSGTDIIKNFAHSICRCSGDWTIGSYIEEAKQYIRETVGSNDTICFVSGGVDSALVSAILSQTKNIGKVHYIYIEALMRKRETEEVVESLSPLGINLRVIKAEQRFIDAVKDIKDPEQKRKAIGNIFGTIMQEVCEELNLDSDKTFLAQGTLYTDLIESGKGVGKIAANIKSHHNVGCEFIENLKNKGRIVEPNRFIFKDEVRKAAKEFGLPHCIYKREPFPGPGLGIRIISPSEITSDYSETNQKVQAIVSIQNFQARILPIKTVGVQGDSRTYRYLALLKGSRDWNKIRQLAKEIPKQIPHVNRIVYDLNQDTPINNMPVYTIPTFVTKETVSLLQDIDHECRSIIADHQFPKPISQTIIVLFGADPYRTGKPSVCLRAVQTDDFMTVSPTQPMDNPENAALTWDCLYQIRDTLLQKYDVGAFVIDVTDKPPATTCWE